MGRAAAVVSCHAQALAAHTSRGSVALQVYLKGFTEGVLKVGPHAGKKVSCGDVCVISLL